jgi:hypothetical protein
LTLVAGLDLNLVQMPLAGSLIDLVSATEWRVGALGGAMGGVVLEARPPGGKRTERVAAACLVLIVACEVAWSCDRQ